MVKVSKRAMPVRSTIAGAIETGFSIVEELKDEIEELLSNMEQSEGLTQTQRYATFEETKSVLEDAYEMIDDIHELFADLPCTYTEDQRRREGSTRRGRLDNALSALGAAKDAVESWRCEQDIDSATGTQEELDELEAAIENADEVINALDERIGNLEGCEFPGMYG